MSGLSTHERFLCRLTVSRLQPCFTWILLRTWLTSVHMTILGRDSTDLVAEPAAGDLGAGGGGDRGAERGAGVRLVPQGQAQAGAEPRHRRPAVGRPTAPLNSNRLILILVLLICQSLLLARPFINTLQRQGKTSTNTVVCEFPTVPCSNL